jgi:hypothetical protein
MGRFGVPGDPFARHEAEEASKRAARGVELYYRNARIFRTWNTCPSWWRWTVWLALAIEQGKPDPAFAAYVAGPDVGGEAGGA